MMTDYSQLTTSDTLPALRLLAILHGYATLVNRNLKRVRSYHELVEDEWKGRQSALEYLRKGTRDIQFLQKLPEEMLAQIQGSLHKERIATTPLWEGFAASIADEVKTSTTALDTQRDVAVDADLRMLGTALREITTAVHDARQEPTTIRYQELFLQLRSEQIEQHGLMLTEGGYAGVFVLPENAASAKPDDFLPVETIIENRDDSLPEEGTLLAWFGTMHLHDGAVLLHKQGIGNGVLLLLPVAGQNEPVNIHARTVNGRNETILLVDDEDVIWDVVQNILINLGYTVILAADGQEAVDIYRANPGAIDLVILDMMMPVLNGRDAFYQLKQISPGVKVLLTSGYVNSQDVADVLENGAAGFLQKPYRIQSLAEKIRSILK